MDVEQLGQRRAVVADDDAFARTMVASVVSGLGYDVIVAGSGAEALKACRRNDPDLAVLDLDLGPGPNGVEVLQTARADMPWIAGVILTGHRSVDLVMPRADLDMPNTSYVVKADLTSTQLLATAIDNAVQDVKFTMMANERAIVLSATQARLLRLVALGLSNEEIATQCGCSVRAVENLTSRLYKTLGLSAESGQVRRVMAARMYHDGQVTTKSARG